MYIKEFYLTIVLYLNIYKYVTIIKNIEDRVKQVLKTLTINILSQVETESLVIFATRYIFYVNGKIRFIRDIYNIIKKTLRIRYFWV